MIDILYRYNETSQNPVIAGSYGKYNASEIKMHVEFSIKVAIFKFTLSTE